MLKLNLELWLKKIVQDKRWEKFTESRISREISELFYTGVIVSLASWPNSLYSDGLIKPVSWLAENTRKEERHKLSKEAKAGICYLNQVLLKSPNEINNFFKNKQSGQ